MKDVINVTSGPLKIVNLSTFLKFINRSEFNIDRHVYRFNVLATQGAISAQFIEGDLASSQAESTYNATQTYLLDISEEEAFKTGIYSQLYLNNLYKRDVVSIIEDVSVDCLENFGIPTHLVRIDPRTWLICNPDDFTLVYNHRGKAVVCRSRPSNRLFTIERTLESDLIAGTKVRFSYISNLIDLSDESLQKQFRKLS